MNGVCAGHNRLEEKLDDQISHCHKSTTEVRENMGMIKTQVSVMDAKVNYIVMAVDELTARRRRFQDKINYGITIALVLGALSLIGRTLVAYVSGGGQ